MIGRIYKKLLETPLLGVFPQNIDQLAILKRSFPHKSICSKRFPQDKHIPVVQILRYGLESLELSRFAIYITNELQSLLGDKLKRIILITALLCCATLTFSGLAATPQSLGLNQLKQSGSLTNAPATKQPANSAATQAQVPQENITILKQDSGTDISKMNITVAVSPTYGSAQTVKFTAPAPGWKLQDVLIIATDGWNASSKQLPTPLPFAIEVRDANLKLLYHFADTQLPYFTSSKGIGLASVEVPDILVSGDFFVCFYGYRSLALAAELQNATGNSYLFDKPTGQLYSYGLPLVNNQTLPINWLIRVAGR